MGAPIVRRNTIRVPHDVARYLRLGHPWVYREAVGSRPLRDAPGEGGGGVGGDGEPVGGGPFRGGGHNPGRGGAVCAQGAANAGEGVRFRRLGDGHLRTRSAMVGAPARVGRAPRG